MLRLVAVELMHARIKNFENDEEDEQCGHDEKFGARYAEIIRGALKEILAR